MCELYPGFRSCCGIPQRVGLLFIAVLSIVTGAMMNAAIKKAGVDVSSIQEVLDLTSTTTTSAPQEYLMLRSGTEADVDDVQDVKTKIATRSQTTTSKPRWSTVEIIGEDGRTEIIRFQDDEASDDQQSDKDAGSGNNADDEPTTTTTTTTPTPTTTTTIATTTDVYTRAMGKVNRNGLNILAIVFIALGIFLLVANFMNSPEMALLYVALVLATCVASLVLLTCVVGECARAQQACLLKKLDWFSGFILTLFWFVYIFVWAFFAAVANGMAREMQTY